MIGVFVYCYIATMVFKSEDAYDKTLYYVNHMNPAELQSLSALIFANSKDATAFRLIKMLNSSTLHHM